MPVTDFVLKTFYVTCCVWVLLYWFYPRYERIDNKHRFDVLTGRTEVYIETHGVWSRCSS